MAGESDGTSVVPARLLSDVIRSVESGTVDITVDDTDLQVVAGKVSLHCVQYLRMNIHYLKEFPRSCNSRCLLTGERFRASYSCSFTIDDSRPILTGVYMVAEETGFH